ncbi:MAG: D-alanyl-D-alanine carboxypeptidase [Candidatus Tectomicrobia bacterium]|uniref:serine-type D-Ala-D-Ala carboxypeptidase n=1 Tax=Tectimicrobiota bacterium TaxID=2528274 RepID=A0A932CQ42_UNCTE|nr:D-alanyl-D-alanine carboxypeptidase [Candidatus Tectomicrobia bacterium]
MWLIAIAFLVLPGLPEAQGASNGAQAPEPSYRAALLVEADTGQVLSSYEPHRPWPMASVTKMMLMLLVGEKLKEGSLRLTDSVIVSRRASKIGGSQAYLKEGESFPVGELMKAIVIHSANDACVAVAEHVAGSAEGMVELMNQRAAALGMKDTQYHSVHGLPPEPGQQEDVSTAFDLALLAQQLARYPQILRWSSTVEDSFRGGKFQLLNTNKLLLRFPGVDGLKTGFYGKAGHNLVATAKRNGMRFIAVVLGASSSGVRFTEAARLLSRGFNGYERVMVVRQGSPVGEMMPVIDGKRGSIRPVAARDGVLLIPKGQGKNIKTAFVPLAPSLAAPVPKGKKLGTVQISLDGQSPVEVAAIAAEEVPQSSLLWRILVKLFYFLKEMVGKLISSL